MDQPKDGSKSKTPDKKPAPQANNLLWYMLGLGVLLLLLMTMWGQQDKLTIQWSDFEKLIAASKKSSDGKTTYIKSIDNTAKPPIERILRDPLDIRVGSTEVTGTVMVTEREATGDAEEPVTTFDKAKRRSFRVASSPYVIPRALELLAANGIENYGNEEMPSQLLSYLPVLSYQELAPDLRIVQAGQVNA
jgi:hypothetical protein